MSTEKEREVYFTGLNNDRAKTILDLSKTPEDHLRVCVKENQDFLVNLFNTPQSREAFAKGEISLDSDVSTVSLLQNSETVRTYAIDVPFSEQMDMELKITDEIPEFLVNAKMTVG